MTTAEKLSFILLVIGSALAVSITKAWVSEKLVLPAVLISVSFILAGSMIAIVGLL